MSPISGSLPRNFKISVRRKFFEKLKNLNLEAIQAVYTGTSYYIRAEAPVEETECILELNPRPKNPNMPFRVFKRFQQGQRIKDLRSGFQGRALVFYHSTEAKNFIAISTVRKSRWNSLYQIPLPENTYFNNVEVSGPQMDLIIGMNHYGKLSVQKYNFRTKKLEYRSRLALELNKERDEESWHLLKCEEGGRFIGVCLFGNENTVESRIVLLELVGRGAEVRASVDVQDLEVDFGSVAFYGYLCREPGVYKGSGGGGGTTLTGKEGSLVCVFATDEEGGNLLCFCYDLVEGVFEFRQDLCLELDPDASALKDLVGLEGRVVFYGIDYLLKEVKLE